MPECDVTLALRSDKCDSRKTSCVPETNTTTWSFPFRGSYFSCVLWGILLHEFWLCGAFGIVGDVYTDLVTTYPKYAKDRYVEIQFSSTKKVVEENKKITWMKAVETCTIFESRRNTIFRTKKQYSLLFFGLIREAILQEKCSFFNIALCAFCKVRCHCIFLWRCIWYNKKKGWRQGHIYGRRGGYSGIF